MHKGQTMTFKELCQELETQIQGAYEQGVTMEEAERLAAKFLFAQLQVTSALKVSELDSRMRKSGIKAVRAAIYLEIVQSAEKKPTESQITAMLDSDAIIQGEQRDYDTAEVNAAELERYYSIFSNAHVYFRGIAKGTFNG
jgi:hypothetical protein